MNDRKFIYVDNDDIIYNVKMIDYEIIKPNSRDIYSQVRIQKVNVLSEAYLDVLLYNGETIFPNINNKTLTMINHRDGHTEHNIYATSVKELLGAVNDSLKRRVVSIRTEIDDLKDKELKVINTMTKILEMQREEETIVTTEEFASMAL